MKVLKSHNIKNIGQEDVNFVLDRVKYRTNKKVGEYVKNGTFDSVIFAEDEVSSFLGFSDGYLTRLPRCISELLDYIVSLYEEDFNISSLAISENRWGGIDIDILNVYKHEVYTYRFVVNGSEVCYSDEYFNNLIPTRYDEQPFPSIDSGEPDGNRISSLLKSVLVYLTKAYNFPIRRIWVYSQGETVVGSNGDLCYRGISSLSNYYGVRGIFDGLYEDDVVFNVDGGEYDLCFLIKD